MNAQEYAKLSETERAERLRRAKTALVIEVITMIFMGIAAAGAILQMLQ